MEKWKKDYERYKRQGLSNSVSAQDSKSIVHRCPYCSAYLWADENHVSYRYCINCGRSLKGKKLPFERI